MFAMIQLHFATKDFGGSANLDGEAMVKGNLEPTLK